MLISVSSFNQFSVSPFSLKVVSNLCQLCIIGLYEATDVFDPLKLCDVDQMTAHTGSTVALAKSTKDCRLWCTHTMRVSRSTLRPTKDKKSHDVCRASLAILRLVVSTDNPRLHCQSTDRGSPLAWRSVACDAKTRPLRHSLLGCFA